jgi:hypothetical protein
MREDDRESRLVAECLARHDATLRAALRATLIERTFPPHPRLRGRALPLGTETDPLVGIRIIYTYGDFVPLACGMSRAAGWKCGARRLLDLGGRGLLDGDLDGRDLLDDEEWGSMLMELVERWIRAAWLEVRTCAPDLRGFVSEHDTNCMTDLDTGASVCEDEIELGYL